MGHDVIPYRVASDQTYRFALGHSGVASAVLLDGNGVEVVRLTEDAPATPVFLPAGDYALVLETAGDENLVFVVPDACVPTSTAANAETGFAAAAAIAAPGVYIQPVGAAQTIVDAPTSYTAFVGTTAQGAIDTPTRITRWQEYVDAFGMPGPDDRLGWAVYQFFVHGGEMAQIVRVPGASTDGAPLAADLIAGVRSSLAASITAQIFVLPDLVGMQTADIHAVLDVVAPLVTQQRGMLVLDTPLDIQTTDGVLQWRADLDAVIGIDDRKNVALYYPPVRFTPPDAKTDIAMGVSGAIAGIYAQTDNTSGVWSVPAGVQAALIGDFTLMPPIDASDLGPLGAAGINTIRSLYNYGNVVWGAKTLYAESGGVYSYVNTRRLLHFVEDSIKDGLQWTVFEPSSPAVWAQVSQSVDAFLNRLWMSGAFIGDTASHAYYVVCDASNNPPELASQGLMALSVGLAPVLPAEFVEIHFEQTVASP
ncbi:MAG: phage tail sheath C-terminal domain-containing protein [Ectothiorhodospiraceae bacterium]|nr:phage tail sheath C-terminal domain-containing protein [Ectothiorhodospiraceae bacterium]